MERWKTTVRVSQHVVTIAVTDEAGYEILRARLPRYSDHPRALLTVLEGIALWSGAPVTAAISVDTSVGGCTSDLFGGTRYSADSALVRMDVVHSRGRLRLRGLRSRRDGHARR